MTCGCAALKMKMRRQNLSSTGPEILFTQNLRAQYQKCSHVVSIETLYSLAHTANINYQFKYP